MSILYNEIPGTPFHSKVELYEQLAAQLSSLLAGERDLIANAANFSSLIFHALPNLNWAGFYFLKNDELLLGPFQGQPACVRIAVGQGVCGTAAAKRITTIVPDVHEFAGHIACDSASNSEIVIPLMKGEELIGVLDLDSPALGRFDNEDAAGLEALVRILLSSTWRGVSRLT
ncbi:MAG TPA: GAF domain-containing protein [Pyrinomonadaceae bacterium]|nr:GAF domain-containing protein [Pyrinomonadaceae bacterium]